MKAYFSIFMSLVFLAGTTIYAEESIEKRNADDTVRVRTTVIHNLLTYFPGHVERYLAFAEMLKRRTGAQFIELSSMTRGQPDFEHSQSGPVFEFVMLRSGQYITGRCEFPPKTPAADRYCVFYGGDHQLLSAGSPAIFHLP